MNKELLDIQPRELKFIFERKKRSSCSIKLINNSNEYVAFKVKTTSPKNYCVQPNVGVVQPSSTCSFTVTMQSQREAPPDMQCKDKFLIQSAIVPFGTKDEDVIPSMFMKDGFKYIEENKLKVVLVSPAHSPRLQPINGTLKPDPAHEASISRDQLPNGFENYPPSRKVANAVEELKPIKDADSKPAKSVEEMKPSNDVDSKPAKSVEAMKPSKDVDSKPAKSVEAMKPSKDVDSKPAKSVEAMKPSKDVDSKPAKSVEVFKSSECVDSKPAKSVEELKLQKEIEELKLAKDIEEQKLAKATEELNSKLNEWKMKLSEADTSISKLTVERTTIIQEREALRQELATLRRTNGVRRVTVGFPFLFVCMVGLIGVALGYILHY